MTAEIDGLKAARDEARSNAERFRNSMYAVEEQSLSWMNRAQSAEAALRSAREALEPFAGAAEKLLAYADHHQTKTSVGRLRRARDTLAEIDRVLEGLKGRDGD